VGASASRLLPFQKIVSIEDPVDRVRRGRVAELALDYGPEFPGAPATALPDLEDPIDDGRWRYVWTGGGPV